MRTLRLLPLLALAVAPEVRAEDAQLQPVVVEAPAPQAPGEADRAPAASTTIIDAQGPASEGRTISELVARAPGAVVHSYGGPGQLATLSLRGASSEQCLVMLDGVPMTSATNATVNLADFPTAFLDRIEVVRGVVGPIYGPGALGGAVNLVTRVPQPGPPTLDALVRGGSFGTGELHLAGTASVGSVSALAAVNALGSRGDFSFRPPDATTDAVRQNNDARQTAGLARVIVPAGPGRTVDVLAQAESGERGLAGSIYAPSSVDRLEDTRATASARLNQELSWGALEVRGTWRQEQVGVSLDRNPSNPQLDALAGAEARLRMPLGHHGLMFVASAAGESLTQQGQPAHTRPELAAGASDEWLLWDGRISLLPALRVDQVDHFTGVSPQLALAYRPIDGLELRGTIGQTFRAPTFGELYVNDGLLLSNPSLQPERALATELGASYERGMLRASAAAFATEYVDLIEYELYPPFLAKPYNVGTAGIGGLEAEVGIRPRPELELDLVYSRQWTADLYDDVRFYEHELPYHPHHRGGARAAWTGSRLTAHVEAFAQSSQYLSRANTAELAGRVDTGAGLAFRPLHDQPLWLGVEAQNLLDQPGYDLYGYPLPGRALYALVRVATPKAEHP
ncbi:MAG: TonB-dependent receptor [Deltaproteobacteria bacterium]|nr:TonB-dependent receptor [Deltaproteobacteria bacterium]